MGKEKIDLTAQRIITIIKSSNFVPKLLLTLLAFGLLTVFIQVANSFVPEQSLASSSVSVSCTAWQKGTPVNTRMVVHSFGSQQECERAMRQGLGPNLVGDVNGCNNSGNHCVSTGSCTAGNRVGGNPKPDPVNGGSQDHSYSCGSPVVAGVPSCSVAQLDCLSGINGAGGAIEFNCGGCAGPTPPPPPPPPPGLIHYECEGFACVLKQGGGQSNCRPNTNDCVPIMHNVCRNQACGRVIGPGRNECFSDSECQVQTHLQCVNNSCQRVVGGGSDNCNSDWQCEPVVNQNVVCDSLNLNTSSGNVPLNVSATLSGHTNNGGSVVSYKFNFGDGTGEWMQSGQTLSHTYNRTGTFVINAFAVDNLNNQAGGSGACQRVVSVTSPFAARIAPVQKIPSTGAETGVIISLFGTGTVGWLIRKIRVKK